MVDLMLKDVPEEFAKELLNQRNAEVAFRNGKKRFESFKKFAVQIADEQKNVQANMAMLSKLNIALAAANMVATIACAVVICNKLNKIDQKLDGMQKELGDLKDINFETQIANPCRMLIGDYKIITDSLEKKKPVSEDEMVALIRGCQNYLVSLYNLRGKLPMDPVLSLIFTLLPIYTNCIMLYYQRFYDVKQDKHTLHDDWMFVYEMLLSDGFLCEVQDYMFIDKRHTNREVNEYLICQRQIVQDYKEKIDELLADLNDCEGIEGYEDAMKWSRQYAAQQAKAVQAELESKYGAEKAGQIMDQAMQVIEA